MYMFTEPAENGVLLKEYRCVYAFQVNYGNAPINVKPAGGGNRTWGGDLIVFLGPGVGHLTDPVLPGEGIFESFFARRRDI